jgi:DNA-binding IclR family transcriptional regulator
MTQHQVLGDGEPVAGTQSVERALTLLSLVGRGGDAGASLTAIVAASGLNKPTVRRLLMALIRARLLEQDAASRRYRLGQEAYVLGTLAARRHGLLDQAAASLRRLSKTTGDASFVSARHGNYAVCLHREEGHHPVRTHALQTGDQQPLGIGAGSLAILAALPADERDATIRDLGPDYAARPGYWREIVAEDVAAALAAGYALNPGRFVTGSWGIGVPVRYPDGRVAGALSIAAVDTRMLPDRRRDLARLLTGEARAVEAEIAKRFGPSGPAAGGLTDG